MRLSMFVFMMVLAGFLSITVGCNSQIKKAEIPEKFEPPPKEGPISTGVGEKIK